MTDTASETATRPTISDFLLARAESCVEPKSLRFMNPYTNPKGKDDSTSWESFGVFDGKIPLNYYVVSPSLKAYVTEYIVLTDGEAIGASRLTRMRHRDMMVDNYLAAGGDLKTWRYIGFYEIQNKPTRDLIEKSFRDAGKDFTQRGSIEFLPRDSEFTNVASGNPFTRGILSLLNKYEKDMGKAKIKRFIFISSGGNILGVVNPKLYLVVELCRPGDNGYSRLLEKIQDKSGRLIDRVLHTRTPPRHLPDVISINW
ncbi:hypothetical protein GGR58DRAFT_238036 [Xylaria digitata]|nr:hypothetical protein GGR58DRAFT_238036 [Xylaria digitata]